MIERTRQQSTANILSRFLSGLKRAFPSSSSLTEDPAAPSELEICCKAGNIVLNQDQIQELYEFIEEACHNRDQRIPQLEASLSEANNVISDQAKDHAALLERLSSQAQETEAEETLGEPADPPIQSDLLQSPQSSPPPVNNKQPTNCDLLLSHQASMAALNQQIEMLEIDNQRMRETLERYEVAVAMYKGDRRMLLTDALMKSFTSPNYKLLVPQETTAEPEKGVTLGIETDFVDVPLPQVDEDLETDAEPTCQIPQTIVTMMQGCWMYKYPRRRFHRLICLPCLPLGKLTYRYFWFCPENKAVMWQDKGSFFSSSSCKVVKVKDVVLEKRRLDRQIGERQDMIEVIVVIPESGLPLAIIPTTADEFKTWKEGLSRILEKQL